MNNEQVYFEEVLSLMRYNGQLMYPGALCVRAAQLYPENIALFLEDETSCTYLDLYKRVSAFIDVLKEHGVKQDDRVMIMIENSLAFYIAYYAAWQLGCIVVPVNTFLREHELEHIISDAEPAIIVCDVKVTSLFIHVKCAVLTADDVYACGFKQSNLQRDFDEGITLKKPEELVALLYTSGTTGLPKGVMLSGKNIMTNIAQGIARFDYRTASDERVLGVLPLFHVFAQNVCVWTTFFVGFAVVLVRRIERKRLLASLKYNPTVIIGVPALYGLFCMMKTIQFNYVRYFISGGDLLPDKIRIGFSLLYQRKICSGYGLTEASPFVAVDLEDTITPSGTIGRVLCGITYKIVDENDMLVVHGKAGKLMIKGDNVMKGYHNAQQATDDVLKDGWLDTGDLVYERDDHKLVVVGREKDLIIHKGFNVYPQEIENVILLHKNVLFVGVVGKQDDDVGQHVIAFVQTKYDQDTIEQELRDLCTQYLAAYKVPKQFICSTDQLPLTGTRKVDKKRLRKKI